MPAPTRLDPAALDDVVGGVVTTGSANADRIVGYSQNDVLSGEGGADAIAGGGGHDTVNGGAGADVLQGDAGDDYLDGGYGDRSADRVFGGDGNDRFTWYPGNGNDTFQGMNGQDTLAVPSLSLDDLRGALQMNDPSLRMQVSFNIVSFTDPNGQPASFSGSITVGGERLSFSEIEKIQVRVG